MCSAKYAFKSNNFVYQFVTRSELGETDTESEIGAHGRKGRRVSSVFLDLLNATSEISWYILGVNDMIR